MQSIFQNDASEERDKLVFDWALKKIEDQRLQRHLCCRCAVKLRLIRLCRYRGLPPTLNLSPFPTFWLVGAMLIFHQRKKGAGTDSPEQKTSTLCPEYTNCSPLFYPRNCRYLKLPFPRQKYQGRM